MAKSVSADAISTMHANPSPDSSSDLPEIVVQVLDLKLSGNRYTASDGRMKLRGILPSNMYSEVLSGKIFNRYDSEGKDVSLADITSNPSLGEDKPAFFIVKGHISFIDPELPMFYGACKTCNYRVGSCECCQKDDLCELRYNIYLKIADASGEAYVSVFNKEA